MLDPVLKFALLNKKMSFVCHIMVVMAGISMQQSPEMNVRWVLLTAAKLERAGMCIHGEILQLHGAFC